MKRNNKTRTILIAALLVIALIVSAMLLFGAREERGLQQGNLLQNGNFASVSGGMPDGWNTGMWVTSAGASYLEAVTLPPEAKVGPQAFAGTPFGEKNGL